VYTLDHVHKRYGNTQVLVDLDGEIPTNKFVFLLGPSGSGKSTLLRVLSLIETPSEGSVHLDLSGRKFNSQWAGRPWPQLTCVFQKQFLWPHLTLRENIALPLRGGEEEKAKVQEVIELFDMVSFVDRHPNEVSGGQAQRAALARAFALGPELILIDEAHGGLDLEQQQTVNSHLVSLRETGVGLVVVTHSLDFARRFADHVLIIEEGVLTENGPRSVFERPKSPFLKRALG